MKNRILKYTFTLFLGLVSFTAYSQYTSINSGLWSDNSIWNTPPPAPTGTPPTVTIGSNLTISSGTEVTSYDNISVSGNSIILQIDGILIINGDLLLGNNKEEIHISSGGMLIVLGNFTAQDNKFSIDAGGYFYVSGITSFSGAVSQKTIIGPENIFFDNPPNSSYPGPGVGYSDCYQITPNPCSLPDPIQEAVGNNNITVSPNTIEGCVSAGGTSFTFTLPTASSTDPNYTGNIYYKVIRDYNTGSEVQVGGSGYILYSGPQDISINEDPSGHTYSVLFYQGTFTPPDQYDILTGFKVVTIDLSNPPTTGTITN